MRSLRSYLVVLVLAAMLPGILLIAVLVRRAFVDTRAASERRLLEFARVDAAALDREFTGAIRVLEALATSPTLDQADLQAFHAEGRRVQATQPGWYTIVLLTPDSRQLLSTTRAWGSPVRMAPEPASLQQVVATGRPLVGTVQPAPLGGPEFLFAVRVPVRRSDQLKYVLSAIVNVTSLNNVVPSHSRDTDEWTRTILDPAGTIAVRTRGEATFVGTSVRDDFRERLRQAPESVTREVTREGEHVYAATSRGAFGWTNVVVVPRPVLDGAINASTLALVLGGVLLMGSGLVAVFVVSRRLAVDLAAATAAAGAVAAGRPVLAASGHVTETQQLHASLASAATLLEQRARERDEQVRVAEDANRTKDHFLALLGHELRNPLAPALTALELMRIRAPEQCRREREVIERQIAHMRRLVDDLLDLSRVAAGKTQMVRLPFELRDAVDRAVDMVQPQLLQQRHHLTVDVAASGLPVHADRDRIVQVIANLLSNAARYTPSNGRIAIAARQADRGIRLVCEDNGPGVPPELLPTLFQPFAQGPRSLDRRDGGLGLGLALARRFTELNGGTLSYEAVDGGGSRFVVDLPVTSEATHEPASRRGDQPASHGERHRVLVVDDNEDAAEMLSAALREAGHTVATATSSAVALEVVSTLAPDVAVLDVGLPGMNGYELAQRLRRDHASMRLIALTGYGQAADVAAAASAGFDVHLTKPVSIASLLEAFAVQG